MTKSHLFRRICGAVATGLLSIALLVGCGGGSGGGSNNPDTNKQTKAPPTETFKYGTHEAKVYALSGIDLQDKIRTWRLASLGDDIFFQVGNKPAHMAKVTLKGETLSDYVDLGETGDSTDIAVNDKVVLWEGHNYKLVTYDGKETVTNGRWPGQIISKTGRGGIVGREEFFFIKSKTLFMGKLKDGTLKDTKEIVKDLSAISPDFNRAQIAPVCSDETGIYLRYNVNKPGDNRKFAILVALDKNGKEIQRYEGVPGGRREFCVTEKYVVYADAEHNVRVFDKKSGKLLGDAKVSFQPFALWTIKGNEVLAYDEVSKQLYRIEF